MSALTGQAPINLGPLTTTFTPPPECTVAVGADRGFLGIGAGPSDVAWLGQSCSRGKPSDATTCWPPTSRGAEEGSRPLQGWGFYSPGIHCPAGYATACSATGGGRSGWPVQFQLRDGETAVGCCPSGYGCANIDGQTCTMIATSTAVPTVTCDGTRSGDFAFLTVPDEEASITALSLFAPMIQVNWQSSDRPESTSGGRSARPTRANTDDPPLTSTGTQTIDIGEGSDSDTLVIDDDPQTTATGTLDLVGGAATATGSLDQKEETSDGEGLSSGARVGLAVAGSSIVVVILVCAMFYCWRRRKNQQEEQEMDRLYGLKHASGLPSDPTTSQDIPGWYRGQRLMTPTHDPFQNPPREPQMPASPYYRGYGP
ncbi:Proline-rich receptor-like protein kinase PERK2 [Madurella fahalii]|uniref:Proline-rich receptor-like protein kinase PERK2 n=1 Tax=Madurella fahalii TaxID=1157608 RepID=A0ABQ0FWL3_9PEZI